MTVTEPHRLLSRTIGALEIGILPDDCRDWLVDGMRRFLAGDETLDACLHLQPEQGKPSVPTAVLRDRRNMYIRSMTFFYPGGILDQAEQIAAVLAGRSPADPHAIVAELVLKISSLGVRIPCSKIHIWKILSGYRS